MEVPIEWYETALVFTQPYGLYSNFLRRSTTSTTKVVNLSVTCLSVNPHDMDSRYSNPLFANDDFNAMRNLPPFRFPDELNDCSAMQLRLSSPIRNVATWRTICEFIKTRRNLVNLVVEYANVDDEKSISLLSDAIRGNENVKRLTLEMNEIASSSSPYRFFNEVCCNLERLRLVTNLAIRPANFPKLVHLNAMNDLKVNVRFLNESNFPNLVELDAPFVPPSTNRELDSIRTFAVTSSSSSSSSDAIRFAKLRVMKVEGYGDDRRSLPFSYDGDTIRELHISFRDVRLYFFRTSMMCEDFGHMKRLETMSMDTVMSLSWPGISRRRNYEETINFVETFPRLKTLRDYAAGDNSTVETISFVRTTLALERTSTIPHDVWETIRKNAFPVPSKYIIDEILNGDSIESMHS